MEKIEQEKEVPSWTATLPEYDCSDKPCIYPYCRTQDNKACCFTNKETP
jgi:hypothetical protein